MIECRFRLCRGSFTLDVEFSVPARGVTAVFGPSGCGKTSLLRAIAGLERDPHGRLVVGESVWQDGASFVPPHKRPLGYVFQEASLFHHLSVRRNLEYGMKRVASAQRRVGFDEAVELLGLGPLLERRPADLSGGERQRAAVARALLTSPRLLLMDEPLAALDLASKREILPYLERLRDELAIPLIYVSHSPDEVARLADYLALMEGGRVLAAGPIGEMLTRIDLPLAHAGDAESMIEAVADGYDPEYQLTYFDFPGGRFTVAGHEVPRGRRARLRVMARDVSITLEPPRNTSILNVFPATVETLAQEDAARVTVRLAAGGAPLLARITRKSAAVLELKPGKAVYAQVKSVALLS